MNKCILHINETREEGKKRKSLTFNNNKEKVCRSRRKESTHMNARLTSNNKDMYLTIENRND